MSLRINISVDDRGLIEIDRNIRFAQRQQLTEAENTKKVKKQSVDKAVPILQSRNVVQKQENAGLGADLRAGSGLWNRYDQKPAARRESGGIGIFFAAIEWVQTGANLDAFNFKLENNLLNGTADFSIANTHIFVWDINPGRISGLKTFLENNTGVGSPGWVNQLTYGPINYQTSPKPNPDKFYPLANDFESGGSDKGDMLIEFISLSGSIFTSDTFIYTGYLEGGKYFLFRSDRYIWPAGEGGTDIIEFN